MENLIDDCFTCIALDMSDNFIVAVYKIRTKVNALKEMVGY